MFIFLELVKSGFIIRPYSADDHSNIGIPNSSCSGCDWSVTQFVGGFEFIKSIDYQTNFW